MLKKQIKMVWAFFLGVAVPFLVSCQQDEDDPKNSTPPTITPGVSYQLGHKICVFGDSGTGDERQLWVASVLEKEGCQEIRHVGDIIYERGIKSASDKLLQDRFLNPYKNLLSSIPFYMALGNHDHLGNEEAWIDVAKQNPKVIFPSLYFADTHGDVCFVTFDTDNSSTHQAQSDWLDSIKSELATSCRLSVAVGHHPYLSVGSHGDAEGDQKDLLERSVLGHFDLYLAGHDHDLSDEGEVSGTHFLVSGAGAQLRDLARAPRVWAASELGYLTLVYQSDDQGPFFNYQFIKVSGKGKGSVVHSGVIRGHGLR